LVAFLYYRNGIINENDVVSFTELKFGARRRFCNDALWKPPIFFGA
jgi:hypothetical protein